jgi:hypothetical protein
MASMEGRGDHGFVAVPPNPRLQLAGAFRAELSSVLPADGGQRTIEFGTTGLIARS